jgi:AraC-like DNA-binding protein
LVVLLSYTLNNVYGDTIQANLLIYVTLSIFLYTFAIKSYRQPQLASNDIEAGTPYKKSGLSESKVNEFIEKIIEHMKKDRPFLDPKLSLSQLSENLKISSHNLSETINTKLNQNFYDFINSYRVEEVKRLIQEDKNSAYSILAHGFEAGFMSKSAYYSAFKKFTGITPAKFRSNTLSIKE